MKLKLLIVTLLATFQLTYAQKQTVIAKFIIMDARINHNDATAFYAKDNSYFVFYLTEDKKVFFGSIASKSNQQSYGAISDLVDTSTPQTADDYARDIFDFRWSYSNSYDNRQGTAKVHLVKISKPVGIAFELTIVPESLDLLEYKGYMEGSLTDLK